MIMIIIQIFLHFGNVSYYKLIKNYINNKIYGQYSFDVQFAYWNYFENDREYVLAKYGNLKEEIIAKNIKINDFKDIHFKSIQLLKQSQTIKKNKIYI